MGNGMAGQGMPMYGMMSVRATPDTAPAGNVTFEVANLSRSIVHEMMIVKVDSPDALLPYDYGRWQVIESQIKVLGDTENISPNQSVAWLLFVTLQCARPFRRRNVYVVLCQVILL